MLFNKNSVRKVNDKKVLHKVGKNWKVVSLALLMAIGGGAVATHANAHADVNTNANNGEYLNIAGSKYINKGYNAPSSASSKSNKPAKPASNISYLPGYSGSAASYHADAQNEQSTYSDNSQVVSGYVNSLNAKFPSQTSELNNNYNSTKDQTNSDQSAANSYSNIAADPNYNSDVQSLANKANMTRSAFVQSVEYQASAYNSDVASGSNLTSQMSTVNSYAQLIYQINNNSALSAEYAAKDVSADANRQVASAYLSAAQNNDQVVNEASSDNINVFTSATTDSIANRTAEEVALAESGTDRNFVQDIANTMDGHSNADSTEASSAVSAAASVYADYAGYYGLNSDAYNTFLLNHFANASANFAKNDTSAINSFVSSVNSNGANESVVNSYSNNGRTYFNYINNWSAFKNNLNLQSTTVSADSVSSLRASLAANDEYAVPLLNNYSGKNVTVHYANIYGNGYILGGIDDNVLNTGRGLNADRLYTVISNTAVMDNYDARSAADASDIASYKVAANSYSAQVASASAALHNAANSNASADSVASADDILGNHPTYNQLFTSVETTGHSASNNIANKGDVEADNIISDGTNNSANAPYYAFATELADNVAEYNQAIDLLNASGGPGITYASSDSATSNAAAGAANGTGFIVESSDAGGNGSGSYAARSTVATDLANASAAIGYAINGVNSLRNGIVHDGSVASNSYSSFASIVAASVNKDKNLPTLSSYISNKDYINNVMEDANVTGYTMTDGNLQSNATRTDIVNHLQNGAALVNTLLNNVNDDNADVTSYRVGETFKPGKYGNFRNALANTTSQPGLAAELLRADSTTSDIINSKGGLIQNTDFDNNKPNYNTNYIKNNVLQPAINTLTQIINNFDKNINKDVIPNGSIVNPNHKEFANAAGYQNAISVGNYGLLRNVDNANEAQALLGDNLVVNGPSDAADQGKSSITPSSLVFSDLKTNFSNALNVLKQMLGNIDNVTTGLYGAPEQHKASTVHTTSAAGILNGNTYADAAGLLYSNGDLGADASSASASNINSLANSAANDYTNTSASAKSYASAVDENVTLANYYATSYTDNLASDENAEKSAKAALDDFYTDNADAKFGSALNAANSASSAASNDAALAHVNGMHVYNYGPKYITTIKGAAIHTNANYGKFGDKRIASVPAGTKLTVLGDGFALNGGVVYHVNYKGADGFITNLPSYVRYSYLTPGDVSINVNKNTSIHSDSNFTSKNNVGMVKAGTTLQGTVYSVDGIRGGFTRMAFPYKGNTYYITTNTDYVSLNQNSASDNNSNSNSNDNNENNNGNGNSTDRVIFGK